MKKYLFLILPLICCICFAFVISSHCKNIQAEDHLEQAKIEMKQRQIEYHRLVNQENINKEVVGWKINHISYFSTSNKIMIRFDDGNVLEIDSLHNFKLIR